MRKGRTCSGQPHIISECRIRAVPDNRTLPLRVQVIPGEHALRNPEPPPGRQHPGEFGQRDGQRPRKVQNAVDIHQVERCVFYAGLGKAFGDRKRKTKVMLPGRTSPMILRRRSTCGSNIVRIRIHADDVA